MTRPKDMPVALQSWANGVYGGGPSWGGTPQRSAPGAAFLTPNVSLPAEVENYLHGNAFDAAQAAINMSGQLPALNWNPAITVAGTQLSVAFSPFDQAWYAIESATSTYFRSFDFGKSWTSAATAVATTATVGDIACDNAGNIVIVGSASNVQDGTWTAYGSLTIANHTAQVAAAAAGANVVYEPSSGLWCAMQGVPGAFSVQAYTSANRATWTQRTIATAWGSMTTNGYPFMGVGNGLIVAAFVSVAGAGGTFRTVRSADGGLTWTNDQAITVNAGINLTSSLLSLTRPTWSAVDGLWYISASQLSGGNKVQVFTSPDAITWSTAATLLTNDCNFGGGMTSLGALLVGASGDGRIFCSFNKGATWFKCGAFPTAAMGVPTLLRSGGNGIMAMGGGGFTPSMRFGLPVTAT